MGLSGFNIGAMAAANGDGIHAHRNVALSDHIRSTLYKRNEVYAICILYNPRGDVQYLLFFL